MGKTWQRMYKKAFPDEPNIISKQMYGRRKWRILKSMSRNALLKDFADDPQFDIGRKMSKEEILKALKRKNYML